MACKYLAGVRIPACLASHQLMHPSIFEQVCFCENNFRECPVYQNREQALQMIVNPEEKLDRNYEKGMDFGDAASF